MSAKEVADRLIGECGRLIGPIRARIIPASQKETWLFTRRKVSLLPQSMKGRAGKEGSGKEETEQEEDEDTEDDPRNQVGNDSDEQSNVPSDF